MTNGLTSTFGGVLQAVEKRSTGRQRAGSTRFGLSIDRGSRGRDVSFTASRSAAAGRSERSHVSATRRSHQTVTQRSYHSAYSTPPSFLSARRRDLHCPCRCSNRDCSQGRKA